MEKIRIEVSEKGDVIMKAEGWDRLETKNDGQLTQDAWMQGYFSSSYENWDNKTRRRNLHELMLRDLTLFTLGDVKDKRILELGCAEGIYLEIIARMGGIIFGQDISQEYINEGLKNLKDKNLNPVLKVGNAAKILFEDNYFDGVIAADFFEHISYEEKIKVVSEVYRVLKPGGIFAIKTPNLDYLRISVFLKRILAVLKFRSPFDINIAHTHNNPDNQHCGLTTYSELEDILNRSMFHFPDIVYAPLARKQIPKWVAKFLFGKKIFCEQIIISARKPLFLGFYP